MKKDKMISLYMDMAIRASKCSFAVRNKVGAILVNNDNIIGFGWNGTPVGFDNLCENEHGSYPWVIHAEQNVYAKAAALGISTAGSELYTTLSPCYDCAKLIIQSKTKTVIYLEQYRITDSINLLKSCNVNVFSFQEAIQHALC